MQPIERRIAALEQANPPADELTIIRRIVNPGHLDAEIQSLRDDDGKLWTRLPGATEQQLIDLATKEATRTPWGVARLIGNDMEVVPC